jgi:hypothetical protein
MIPGPVTGHVPVDPGAAQRQLTEPVGDAGADSGTSFADLLAAMLAPGAPGAQLQAPVAEEAVLGRLDAAEMFNETGLFRGAAPLPSHGAIPAGLSVAAAVSEAPAATPVPDFQSDPRALPASLDPAETVSGVTAAAGAGEGGAAPASVGPAGGASKASHGVMPSLHGQPVSLSAVPGQGAPAEPGAAAGPDAAGGGRVSARTAAIVAQLLAVRAGAAAAQVSVQAVEGGISVMARVDRLSREERDRLRGEIGELLARHGFANADIVLNGEAWPRPKGEEE